MLPIKVVVVDDCPLVLEGTRYVLENDPKIRVVALARTEEAALEHIEYQQPHIVLTEIRLSTVEATDFTRMITRITHTYPGTRVVILTQYLDPVHMRTAFRAGAVGYLSKMIEPSDLIAAVHTVHREGAVLPPNLVRHFSQAIMLMESDPHAAQHGLSRREQEILVFIAEGYTPSEIAASMFISPKTVRNHLSNIYRKLGTKNLVDTALYVARDKLEKAVNSTSYNDHQI